MNNNKKNIKVSVYCLAYNHEKYIRKSLDGFVNQITDFNFEVWVHDDASIDHTAEIICEYADKYPDIIKPIYQKENQYSKGINIWNYIYPQLQGKYIACCEGDDYWNDPYKLQKQFDAMEAHPECSLSTHKVQCCNEDGTPNERVIPEEWYHIHRTKVIEEGELLQCYYMRGGYPFHTSSYFFRRDVLDIKLEYPRDEGILRKCLILGSVYFLDEPMSTRRLWSIGNWSSRIKEGGIQASWNVVISTLVASDGFDQYTDYRYHDYIGAWRIMELTAYAKEPKYRSEIKRLLRKYDLTPWRVKKVLSLRMFLKLEIKYMLAMYFPRGYSCAKIVWRLSTGDSHK